MKLSMNKISMALGLSLSIWAAGLSAERSASAAGVAAPSACSNAQADAKAKRGVNRVEAFLKLKRPDLYRTVNDVNASDCNGSALYAAGANPGEPVYHAVGPTTCGVVLTFVDPAQAKAVARYLRDKNLGIAVCVTQGRFNPHLIVSSGN